MTRTKFRPTYDLAKIKELLDNPATRVITRSARQSARNLGFVFDEEIVERVKRLKSSEFDKSMEALKCPGLWQDVYKTIEANAELYIKLQLNESGAVIVSFK